LYSIESKKRRVRAVGTGGVYTACVGIQYRNGGGPTLAPTAPASN